MQQRLEQHYLRLLRRFDLQAADTTLQSLAETCSAPGGMYASCLTR